MNTLRRLIALPLIGAALTLCLSAAVADAAPQAAGSSITVQCQVVNLVANVSNLGIGYNFSAKCSSPHPFVLEAQWYDAQGNVLGLVGGWIPKGSAGTWSTYPGNLQRPWSGTAQTAYACIQVYQDVTWYLGGPLLASKCFPKNS